MRFGVCAGLEQAAFLASVGYDYLEPSVVGALVPEQPDSGFAPAPAGLTPEAFNGLLPGDLAVVGRQSDPARQERYLETAFARARALGGQVVVFGSGRARQIPGGFDRTEAAGQIRDFVRRCGEAAARHALQVAIEPLHRGECNHINSVAEAVSLARAVGHPAVGVLSDLFHIVQDGQTFEDTEAAAPLLRHVHIAGARDRRAPQTEDLDFLVPYFRSLRRIGYAGRISIEGQWADLSAQAAGALDVLRRAWDAAA